MAADVGRSDRGGNGAIAGVMLESFLVAGRQDLERCPTHAELRYGQSITDGCIGLGDDGRGAARASAESVRGSQHRLARRRRHTERMRIAVLGVGLIGGSIGLAARARADAEVCG